jgi:ketosteroid isomerase-like protein
MWQATDRQFSAAVGREQLDAVRRSLEAWNRGDVDAMFAEAADDTEYAVAEQNPNARLLRGRDEIAAYLRDWRDTVRELRYEIGELFDAGNAVVSLGTMTGRAGDGGPEITAELAFVVRFEGAAVVRTEEYLDAHQALQAVGLR